jgi:hypothetical protein
MSDNAEWDDGKLDALLRAGMPARTVVTPSIEDELARMTVAAGDGVAAGDRPRRTKRVAVFGAALVVLLGGAGAATAATISEWSWWAENPEGKYYYTAPTGESCEVRIGKTNSTSPEIEAMIRDTQGWGEVLDEDRIAVKFDRLLRTNREYEAAQIAKGEDPLLSTDAWIYEQAIDWVIRDYVEAELRERGIALIKISATENAYDYGWSMEVNCDEVTGE